MAIEMTDEEYAAYEKRQRGYQESEEGQRELASAKETYAKREALEKKWKEEEPINDTDSETSVEHTAFHEVAQTAHEEHESLKEKEKEYPKPVHEKQYQSDMVRDEETRQSHVPIKSSSFEDTIVKAKKFGKTGNTTDYASTAQTFSQAPPTQKERVDSATDAFKKNELVRENLLETGLKSNSQRRKTEPSGINFDELNAGSQKAKEEQQKVKDEQYRKQETYNRGWERTQEMKADYAAGSSRGTMGVLKDILTHPHDTAQEIGYAVEKKVAQRGMERKQATRDAAAKRIEPEYRANDQKLNEGKISREMHELRNKQLDEKFEKQSTPIEQRVGGVARREAEGLFGMFNEAITSPSTKEKMAHEEKKRLHFENKARAKDGLPPIEPTKSAMEGGSSIGAAFARGLSNTMAQVKESQKTPVVPKVMRYGATVAPSRKEFGGKGTRKTSPTKGTVISKGKAPGVNFGGGGVFGSPIAFNAAAGRFSLFGGGQPAPAPAPKGKSKKR